MAPVLAGRLNSWQPSEAGDLGTALASINDDDLRGMSMRRPTRTILLPYGGAVVFTALAVLLRWLLDPWLGDSLPLATLYGAVAFAAWLGGYRPALLAVIPGYLSCAYLFIEP